MKVERTAGSADCWFCSEDDAYRHPEVEARIADGWDKKKPDPRR